MLRTLRRSRRPWLHARVFVVAALAPALLRLRLSRLERVLEPRRRRRPVESSRVRELLDEVDAVLTACPPLVRSGCLTRGVTRYWFLRRAGLDVTLAFGMGEVEGGPAGHCWLVRDGEPWLEDTDPRPHFTTLYTIPRVSATA